MSDFSLTLVLQIKTSKNHQWHGKGKHKIWENHSFWRKISCERSILTFCGSSYRQSAGSEVYVIRLSKREIVGSLSSVYFCGGDCVEDVTSHLMPHLSLHPHFAHAALTQFWERFQNWPQLTRPTPLTRARAMTSGTQVTGQCPTHFSQATSKTRLFRRTLTCPLYRICQPLGCYLSW